MDIIVYIILILNGLLVAAAFHIAVLALGIITLEVDYVIWMYRDLMNLGKLPVDVYKQPLRGILTFLVPVALMVTVPAKVAMGLFTLPNIAISLAGGMLIFYLSLRFWKFALRYYTSASS
jgi:ABC-2 type transport system permease protein